MELFIGGVAIIFLFSAIAGGKYILYKCNSIQQDENVYIIREPDRDNNDNELPPKYEEIVNI
mgnify:CR=1 FL=1